MRLHCTMIIVMSINRKHTLNIWCWFICSAYRHMLKTDEAIFAFRAIGHCCIVIVLLKLSQSSYFSVSHTLSLSLFVTPYAVSLSLSLSLCIFNLMHMHFMYRSFFLHIRHTHSGSVLWIWIDIYAFTYRPFGRFGQNIGLYNFTSAAWYS